MKNFHRKFRVLGTTASAVALSMAISQTGYAQVVEEPVDETSVQETVIITGSRFGGRVATDSPTPIDTVSQSELTVGGATELQGMLKVAIPSFSTANPVTAGVADFLGSPTLRGLSPGQVLVLVNGKRRHTNSDLNVGNQLGRGDVAYDFNAIPSIALKSVEVLRDGASAQYGSDAIAGVVNVILDDSLGGRIAAQTGVTSEGDGGKTQVGAAYGFGFGNNGVLRISGQYQTQEYSNRSRLDTRQQYFGDGGLTGISSNFGSGTGLTPSNGVLDPREATIDRRTFIFGQPKYDAYSVFANTSFELSPEIEAYGFAGYSSLEGQNPNFFRRAGQNETVRAIHPDGFIPFQDIDLVNYSGAVGLRGNDLLGFGWDVSTVYGKSETDLGYSNSNNVSFGLDSPTEFDRGGTRLSQWTTNFDLTRQFDMADGAPINLAFGAEYRKEVFEAVAGDPFSYGFGGVPILDGPSAGSVAAAGAQPSGGTSPVEEVDESRDNYALYVELEKEWSDRFLVSAAARFEDYSDFGSTTDYRLATRFKINSSFNIRGSVGTAFRAPALPQSFFQRVDTSFATGSPVQNRIVSVNDPLADLIGARSLKPEKANNLSVGGVLTLGSLSASIDLYQIELEDRIVLSSQFSSAQLTDLLADNGFGEVRAVSFETNAVDTTTKGIDLTLRHRSEVFSGELTSTLAANFTDTKFDRIGGAPAELIALGASSEVFDLRSQVRLAEGTPQSKLTLNFKWARGPWTVNLTNTRYGDVSQLDIENQTPAQVDVLVSGYDTRLVPRAGSNNVDIVETFGAKIVTDLSVAYDVNDTVTLKLGADNLFDIYPDEQIKTTVENTLLGTRGSDNRGIFPYSYLSPFGVAGQYVYGSINVSF